MYQFACPSCGTRLRAKDRSFRGRTVHCPECGKQLLIGVSGEGLVATLLEEESTGRREMGASEGDSPRPGRANRRRLVVASLLLSAATAVAGGLWLAFRTTGSPETESSHFAGASKPRSSVKESEPAASAPRKRASDAKHRLELIGRELRAYADRYGTWPSADKSNGLPAPDRFSWIAILEAARDESLRPDWRRPWHDPVNERFVRRRMDRFLNPLIPAQTGLDRYPATHFVGVAGVGENGPELPADHPRAGVFGRGRATRREEIADGLTSTMLIAGVTGDLGSWAAAGKSTIRPFANEPYVNGPDGFGTGQPESMSVLMADGSVRTVSGKTDPVVVRRMAAMADGFPLDPAAEGDPLDSPVPDKVAQTHTPQPPAPPAGPDDSPIEVLLAPDLRFPFVDEALAQNVVSFDQPNPVELGSLLRQMEEMLGVPIDRSVMTPQQLELAVTLHLEQPTLADVLRQMLTPAGLTFRADPMHGVIVMPSEE